MIAALLVAAAPSIVPWPRSVRVLPQSYAWQPHPQIAMRLLRRRDAQLGDEGYTLSVDARGATAEANTAPGLFYALQTFKQLRGEPQGERTHALAIRDWPAYRWRGAQLDVARHFFDVQTVERLIDVAAQYKLNVFHWHLTDDQGWRLPVRGYPRLTARGPAYTRAQIRAVVEYARRRFVTIVPEIEMPAHASAAIAAYPQLACDRADVLCANTAAFTFLQHVLNDVFELFPGRYVHVGGDEVPSGFDEAPFVQRVERFARAHGRRIAGWDDILSAHPSRSAIVVAWNSLERAAEAAQRGNDVVVSGWPLYFDAAQGDPDREPRAAPHVATLAQVYTWDVMPPGLSPAQKKHILGGESALWSERIRTPEHLFYMLLPRELALAELLWTPRERKSWPSFVARLPAQFDRLASQGYAFRIPNASVQLSGGRVAFSAVAGRLQTVDAWTSASQLELTLAAPIDGPIRYALDGRDPASSASVYVGKIPLRLTRRAPLEVRAVTWYRGRAGTIVVCRIHRVAPGAWPLARFARTFSSLVSP